MSDGFDLYLSGQIRALRDELHDYEAQVDRSNSELARAILQTKRRVFDLNIALVTVIETLVASGALDADVLEARLENKLAEAGWSAEHPEPTDDERPYTCLGCYRAMTIAEGTMTPSGMRCKRCAR